MRLLTVYFLFFFNDTATTEIYTLSLHDALPILRGVNPVGQLMSENLEWVSGQEYGWETILVGNDAPYSRRLQRSEEHTSELQSPCNLVCRLLLEKKNNTPSRASLTGMDERGAPA